MGLYDARALEHGFNQKDIIERNAELGEQITLLAAQINAGTYRFLKLLAEFDRNSGWNGEGIRSCAHWLNWRCGIANSAAREKVRVARALNQLPQINQAFEQGLVSYSKVRAMTRVATNENEDYLLMIARHGTASHIEKLVRKYQGVESKLVNGFEAQQYQERQLSCYQDYDGSWVIKGRLPQVEGALVAKAIDAVIESHQGETSGEETAFEQKRADALCEIAEHYVATASSAAGGAKALAGHERCQVVLHVSAETLEREHTHQNGCCGHTHDHAQLDYDLTHLDGQWICMANAKRLSCDASLLTVVKDKNGNVLNLGRTVRLVTPALKRALDIRDETCRFPGCCQSRYVDFHHIQHWAEGGETKPSNLIKLCRFHHRAIHSGLFSIEVAGTEQNPHFIFKTPTGQVMEPDSGLPTVTDQDYFAKQWPDITSRTGLSLWDGEDMDYGMAVDGLLRRSAHANALGP